MDDTLKRLLDAETKSNETAQEAKQVRERIFQTALREARAEDERFTARIWGLHHDFIDRARERAEQAIVELQRRYGDRRIQPREIAGQPGRHAREAAFAPVLDPRG